MSTKIYYLLGFLFLLNSCAQLSHFQDARTLGDGNWQTGALISAYGTTDTEDDFFNTNAIPYAVIYGSNGLTDKLDLQFSMSSNLNFLFAPKYQIGGTKESNWATSLNPGLEFQLGGDNGFIIRPHLGFITTFYPKEDIGISLEPKVILQFIDDEDFIYPGGSLSVKLPVGEKINLALGVSFFGILGENALDDGAVLYQGGLSGSYNF